VILLGDDVIGLVRLVSVDFMDEAILTTPTGAKARAVILFRR
jgi:hypothetical protein